jgi:alpha-ribazole phosphatase
VVHLIRHTRPDVAPGICYGRSELPLAITAEEDIRAVLDRLPRVDAVFTSPAARCQRLAETIAAERGADCTDDARLLELDFGQWEGKSWDDISRDEIDRWGADLWNVAPGDGESLSQLWVRVAAFCTERRLEDIHNEDTHVVVVAHQGPLRVLHCLGRGVAFDRLFETDFAFGVAGLTLWPQREHRAIAP